MTWYTVGPGSQATGTGSGFDLYGHRSELRVTGNSSHLFGAFDEDGWYESFFGPATPIALAAAMAVVSVMILAGRTRRRVLRTGLWLALVSCLAAGTTGRSGSFLLGELGGTGIRTWASASMVAVIIYGWAVSRSEPGPGRAGEAWLAIVCVLAWLPLELAVYRLEDGYPFDASGVLIASVLAVAIPSTGAVLAFDVLRSRPPRASVVAPAAIALTFGAFVWGVALYAAWVD